MSSPTEDQKILASLEEDLDTCRVLLKNHKQIPTTTESYSTAVLELVNLRKELVEKCEALRARIAAASGIPMIPTVPTIAQPGKVT